jgi:hypothetical protein
MIGPFSFPPSAVCIAAPVTANLSADRRQATRGKFARQRMDVRLQRGCRSMCRRHRSILLHLAAALDEPGLATTMHCTLPSHRMILNNR